MEYAEEITGYDEVDEQSVFGGGSPRPNASASRRHGKKGLSPKPYGRPGRGTGRRFRFDPRQIAGAFSSMLLISAAGVIAVAAILYFTFVGGALPQFYGGLAASMIVMLLLGYIVTKLLGSGG